jgi:hypothetical protein
MFAKKDVTRAQASYQSYQEECIRTIHQEKGDDSTKEQRRISQNILMVNSRQYIDRLGAECGTDDKYVSGTCHESPLSSTTSNVHTVKKSNASSSSSVPSLVTNLTTSSPSDPKPKRYRDPSDMHRCSGRLGGHADLVSWDVIEGLFLTLSG